ncbi:MerR family transcriptional regulator [Saccharibacillus sacchari]|uniref:MerR family transcriptional regulator n=1 Tax=Saccharibacillus sacchari TaxID=456493 RepID=A0ACC6PHV3_9BACL
MIRIGELARKAGVSKRTLHYYEQIGLLKPTLISENGYRHYDEQAVFRLQKIMLLKSIGYTLQQIKTLLHTQKDDGEHQDWLHSLHEQINLLETKKEELSRKQYYLRSAVDVLRLRGMGGMNDLLKVIEDMNERPLVEGVVPAEFGNGRAASRHEKEILANLPVWGSGDERLEQLTLLLEQAAQMMPRSSPHSAEAQSLAAQLHAKALALFEGDENVMDTYWSWITPREGQEPAVIGLPSELMAYVEQIIDLYRKQKEGGKDDNP